MDRKCDGNILLTGRRREGCVYILCDIERDQIDGGANR